MGYEPMSSPDAQKVADAFQGVDCMWSRLADLLPPEQKEYWGRFYGDVVCKPLFEVIDTLEGRT
jgi:hypothetical protein